MSKRNQDVIDACVKSKAIYFGATGGAGALLARQIKSAEVIAYPELGPKQFVRLEVVDFPLTVINDTYGADLYKIGGTVRSIVITLKIKARGV